MIYRQINTFFNKQTQYFSVYGLPKYSSVLYNGVAILCKSRSRSHTEGYCATVSAALRLTLAPPRFSPAHHNQSPPPGCRPPHERSSGAHDSLFMSCRPRSHVRRCRRGKKGGVSQRAAVTTPACECERVCVCV